MLNSFLGDIDIPFISSVVNSFKVKFSQIKFKNN